ncbi:hypothetical protein DQ04_07121000 [Trypanosoma grayi]|uniref:hypothetical protein n=1 Tax=Trypanosoma grayi TaxID=71804 RepID=UPI0004F4739E|nr:hypothetical protein DQ04_07121000 [Trypanosoma grayi]KEG08465.1 hypothetical protein DQ04_07121000 [Trypanosoma grayi]
MRTSSQRRPKSPAASRLAQRTSTPDAPPWNSSVRTEGRTAATNSSDTRRPHERASVTTYAVPERPSYSALAPTPVAVALAASTPPVGEPQVELLSQLQNVVVRLSQNAVGEKQRWSHMQQRIDAYAALVREQDRMIDELRGMNIKLQKEKDALIAFRQQSLNHDFHLMNKLEVDGGIDDEVRRAYAHHDRSQASHGMTYGINPLSTMSPTVRNFVRSLVAQLRDERRKRLEVEEQSSQMIGEQQLTIQRLEDRLRLPAAAPRTSLFGRMETSQASCHNGAPNEERDAINTPMQHPSGVSRGASSPPPATAVVMEPLHGTNRGEKPQHATAAAPLALSTPITHLGGGENITPASTAVSSARSAEAQSAPEVPPLALYGANYEDAAAMLSGIRRRHGL